ncbi:hypothetical protein OIO90_000249 [Microbotryomycetes sp. JL221]|nr:hypothetical protein OIO90_000249 [Microbotryomycetes sp. JL221]
MSSGPSPLHHIVATAAQTHQQDDPGLRLASSSSEESSASSSQSTSPGPSPRSSREHSLTDAVARQLFDQTGTAASSSTSRYGADDDYLSSTASDSYDSAGESNVSHGAHHHQQQQHRGGSSASLVRLSGAAAAASSQDAATAASIDGPGAVQYAQWASPYLDDGYSSSRASSPQPQYSAQQQYRTGSAAINGGDAHLWSDFGGHSPRLNATAAGGVYVQSISRNRSRNTSGTTTPTFATDKEAQDYHSHHSQTSALLRKLGGTLTPDHSPVLGHKQRRPGWWSQRAQSKRKLSNASSTSAAPPLGAPSTLPSKSGRNKSCMSTFGAALLRQPWVPTQPLTILFSFLLFGCFAATLTTLLMHVLSSDREPLPWRQFCQDQRPFPHTLCDSLKPVSVFVGVFSVDASIERRNTIRQTYARHTRPIDPATGRPTQDVQLKFILGRPRKSWARRVALEMEMYNDVVVLDIDENMNKGKTFRYFEWAYDNATVPTYYRTERDELGVGFRKVDYVVKADEDTFINLNELERHLRVTPRERTYWGYLVRNLFMAGEIYALSSDLVQYVATYQPLRQYIMGKEDQRVAKWMRIHPEYSTIHWVSERCWIYDGPKAGTTYSHGYLFPDEVERIRLEGRRGISEEERIRRGGDLAPSFSTVSRWKHDYVTPASGLTIDEQVEALVEGGGRWATSAWRSDYGRNGRVVSRDKVVFDKADTRLRDARQSRAGGDEADREATGVRPGIPDRSRTLPSARTTRFGKDLFRDPSDVEAVQIDVDGQAKRSKRAAIPGQREEDGDGEWVEIHNAVQAPWEFIYRTSSSIADSTGHSASKPESIETEQNRSVTESESPSRSTDSSTPADNLPTGQVKRPLHNYILPPSNDERFLPPPTLRYDPSSMRLKSDRMLGMPHGGTVAVHYLKRNEWFFETALALIGRDKLWDGGVDTAAFPMHPSMAGRERVIGEDLTMSQISSLPPWTSSGQVELVDAYWGGARMYGSPIVLEDGMISEGRPSDARREAIHNVPNTALGGRLTRSRSSPMFGMALEDGVEVLSSEQQDELDAAKASEGAAFVIQQQ